MNTQPHEIADLCIVHGRVFDGRVLTPHTALAVHGGRVRAVGDDTTVLGFQGPGTRVIDACGALIHPGFVDAHSHAAFAGVERLSCDLTPADSVNATLELVHQAAQRATTEWVTGGGWSHDLLPHPTRQMLDAIVPDRPVALSDAGHHTLWVNTVALERAGVGPETVDPPNGHIYRDSEGVPTGYLNETAAELVGRHIPPANTEIIEAGILEAQRAMWALGITGWHEAILGEYNGKADASDAYRVVIANGQLKNRVSGALWVPPGTTADQVPALIAGFSALRQTNADAGLMTNTIKVMVDGVPHGETAALHEPYCSHTHRGELHVSEDALAALILAADGAGFAMHLHVMGDRGMTVALDAIEAARITHGPGPRHHIAHLSMVSREDALRMGPLDITANLQALWAAPDPAVVPMIGEARMRAGYPFRTIADGGAALAMGSDWPVSPAEPWLAIHTAVNRSVPPPGAPAVQPEQLGDPVLDASQALTLTEALTAYTSGSADLVLGGQGTIRVGGRADLVVATADPFSLPPALLLTVGAAVTVVGGDVVWERTH